MLKTCTKCYQTKDTSCFDRQSRTRSGFIASCKECRKQANTVYRREHKEQVNSANRKRYCENRDRHRSRQRKYEAQIRERARSDKTIHAKQLLRAARARAKKFGVPFDLKLMDVIIPELCPILGLRLKRNKGKMAFDSATVDRIIPEFGYVSGNVIVVSLRANLIKTNATHEEITRVGEFYRSLHARVRTET